jgi:tripartite-type tricarboxylate transporter receptor subunit TctC
MVGPKGLPPDIASRYEALFKKVHESDGFKKFMNESGFEMLWGNATEFAAFMKKDNAEIGDMLKLMGLAKK